MLEQRRQQTALALGVLGIACASGGYALFSLTRMLFAILRGSYHEARRTLLVVQAKINSEDPGWYKGTAAEAHQATACGVASSPASDHVSRACLPADENIPEELFLLDELAEVFVYGEQLQVRVLAGGNAPCPPLMPCLGCTCVDPHACMHVCAHILAAGAVFQAQPRRTN
jgi:hypothetical protein